MRIAKMGGASHFIGCEPSSLARGSEVWAYLPTYPRRSPAALCSDCSGVPAVEFPPYTNTCDAGKFPRVYGTRRRVLILSMRCSTVIEGFQALSRFSNSKRG